MRAMIGAARAGDAEQRVKVLEVFRPYLVVIAFAKIDSRVQTKVAPSDAAQMTIIKAFHAFSEFRGVGPESLRRWLEEIHGNAIHDIHRRYVLSQKRKVSVEVPLDGEQSQDYLTALAKAVAKVDTPSAVVSKRELAEVVQSALTALTARQRQVLEMRYLRHLAFEEVGDQLGITASAARMVAIRGLAALKRVLHESGDDERTRT